VETGTAAAAKATVAGRAMGAPADDAAAGATTAVEGDGVGAVTTATAR
jgi:hypothetical protein